MENSGAVSVDRNPTQIPLEDGTMGTPDKEGRFSIAYTKNGREYGCDDKPIDLQSFFGAMTGKDTIPKKSFSGIGEGTMKKAYESEEDFQERIKKWQ